MLAAHAYTCILGAFDLVISKGLTMACNSKAGGHAARNNILESGTLVTSVVGTLGLVVFNIILGSFVVFFFSKRPPTRYPLITEEKSGRHLGTLDANNTTIWDTYGL